MSFLSPLDMLTVSGNEQEVIRCLVRRPNLTVGEIAKFTKIPIEKLETLLKEMVQKSSLVQSDDSRFKVEYGSSKKQNRNGTNLLDSLFGQ